MAPGSVRRPDPGVAEASVPLFGPGWRLHVHGRQQEKPGEDAEVFYEVLQFVLRIHALIFIPEIVQIDIDRQNEGGQDEGADHHAPVDEQAEAGSDLDDPGQRQKKGHHDHAMGFHQRDAAIPGDEFHDPRIEEVQGKKGAACMDKGGFHAGASSFWGWRPVCGDWFAPQST